MLDQTPLADNDFTILSVDPGTILEIVLQELSNKAINFTAT